MHPVGWRVRLSISLDDLDQCRNIQLRDRFPNCNETVSMAVQRFDKRGLVARIIQSITQAPYGGIQACVKIHERIRSPQFLAELLAENQFPGRSSMVTKIGKG
jgi:hypothetical protein